MNRLFFCLSNGLESAKLRGGILPRILLICAATAMFTGCNHLFYHPEYEIYATPAALGIPFKEHQIIVDEEVSIHLWHLDAGKDRLGTIIHFHGNAQNMSTHFLFTSWLVEHGYDVITFDYRGYGKSTGIPSREGLVADGAAVIDWVRKHKKLGKEDIFILGQSLGGAVAIPSVVLAGEKGIRAVIVDSTFASYREIARDRLGTVWLTWPLQYPLSYLVSDEFSPIDSVPKLTVPILVVHGIRDGVVPIEFGRKLFYAANTDRRKFWEVNLLGHTSAFYKDSSPYRAHLADYLCELSSEPLDCQATEN